MPSLAASLGLSGTTTATATTATTGTTASVAGGTAGASTFGSALNTLATAGKAALESTSVGQVAKAIGNSSSVMEAVKSAGGAVLNGTPAGNVVSAAKNATSMADAFKLAGKAVLDQSPYAKAFSDFSQGYNGTLLPNASPQDNAIYGTTSAILDLKGASHHDSGLANLPQGTPAINPDPGYGQARQALSGATPGKQRAPFKTFAEYLRETM